MIPVDPLSWAVEVVALVPQPVGTEVDAVEVSAFALAA